MSMCVSMCMGPRASRFYFPLQGSCVSNPYDTISPMRVPTPPAPRSPAQQNTVGEPQKRTFFDSFVL